jgi:cell division protein ZapD
MADDDQAAHGDSRRRLRIRSAGYHYWLQRRSGRAAERPHGWIEPFLPIYDGLAIILRLCATTAARRARPRIAASFQLMLTTSKVAQLLRLTVPLDLPCVPEISANKYALNIRFIGVTGMDRGTVYDHDVEFELAFCNL